MLKKILLSLILVLVLLGGLAFIFRDWILKTGLEQGVTRLTGFKTTVAKFRYDLPSTVHVQGLEIQNPPGFHQAVFATLPEIYIALDLPPLLRGEKLHLFEVRLALQEVNIEKNEKGVTNVSLLSSIQGHGAQKAPPPPAAKKKAMPFLLDKLVLTVHRVHYEDHSGFLPKGVTQALPLQTFGKAAGSVVPSAISEKNVSIDLHIDKEVFLNITDPKAIVNVIVLKVVYGQTFGNLKELGVDPNELLNTLNLQKTVKDVLGSGTELIADTAGLATGLATQTVTGAVGETGNVVGSVSKETGNAVGTVTQGTKNEIMGLFHKVVPPAKKEESAAGSSSAAS